MRSFSILVATAMLVGCAQPGARSALSATGLGAAASGAAAVDPATLDMPTYERLTADALAAAIAAHDDASVDRFVAWADGPDPQPASTRTIATAALRQARGVAEASEPAIVRIAEGRARAVRAPEATGIRFPEDEGSHAGALTEWWYVNGQLDAKAGLLGGTARYGYELTLFKVGPLLHWAHVAVTDVKGKRFHYTRQGLSPRQATDTPGRLDQTYGVQRFARTGDAGGDTYALGLQVEDGTRLDLALTSKKAPLLIGGDGKIDMPEGKDSWYYSQTRMAATGSLRIDGATKPVTGTSWVDHQWGPFFVSGFADRWDWFSLQFADGTDYNLFGFRDRAGRAGARHVNRSAPDGTSEPGGSFAMTRLAWWVSPVTKLNYTTKWRIDLPKTGETVELEALVADQEVARTEAFVKDPLPHYWEGAMKARKRLPDGKTVEGTAYCEHFGLKAPSGPAF